MTRVGVPHRAYQRAVNVSNDARKIASHLTTSTTLEGINQAEQARVRAMNELRALAPILRDMKRQAKADKTNTVVLDAAFAGAATA
jgi:hypothetical protein